MGVSKWQSPSDRVRVKSVSPCDSSRVWVRLTGGVSWSAFDWATPKPHVSHPLLSPLTLATFTLIMNKVCQQWVQKTKFLGLPTICPLLFWIILITIHIPIKSASNWTENDWVVHQDPDHRLKVSTFPVNPSTFNLLPENLPRISSPTCDITQISLEMFLSTPSLSLPWSVHKVYCRDRVVSEL